MVVHIQEVDALSVDTGVPGAGTVSRLHILDLDHLSAEIRQLHSGDGRRV